MMAARNNSLLATAVFAIVLIGGCGGGGKKTVTPAAGTKPATTIKEVEYSLSPGTIKVTKAGTVTLTAQNGGKMTHALEIEGNGVEKKTANIQPGSSAQLTVSLKPGSYDLYCPIDGHRQLGMKATLTVAGGSSGAGASGSTSSSSGY